MKRKISLFLAGICLACSQNIRSTGVLTQIEQNNTALSVLRKQTEAEKAGNRTGLSPENPTVEYHYLWGSRPEAGNRTDVAVNQNFDFPTAYYYRKKNAAVQDRRSDLRYRIERKDLLLEAKRLCIELTYQNARHEALRSKALRAESTAEACRRKLDAGEINRLDYNRALLNAVSARKELASAAAEKASLSAELARLNGGMPVAFTDTTFEPVLLSADFELLFDELKAKNLTLAYLKEETEQNRWQLNLRRSLNLPKISAGYMSEKTPAEHFRGVTVGVSLPLWENRRTVRQSKAQLQAGRLKEEDARARYYNEAKALHQKAATLDQLLREYRAQLQGADNTRLLQQALEVGEVSLTEYLLDAGLYFDAAAEMLDIERELHLTLAELMQWDL
ncbi:MAG: TolC family protein [Dysgonamonadaceae bacterium]|jgi:outer membrane protein TolC|nr:TolC family protein [Dysgonamonadaceae bacterium]